MQQSKESKSLDATEFSDIEKANAAIERIKKSRRDYAIVKRHNIR